MAAPGLAEYPSLRDLETSNAFSRVNHNFNIQRHLDARRMASLEELRSQFVQMRRKAGREEDADYCITYTQLAPRTKERAVTVFMDLLVFSQAGFCELKQTKLREAAKFEPLRIYKMH